MNFRQFYSISIFLIFFNSMVTCIRANNFNLTRPKFKSIYNNKFNYYKYNKIIKFNKYRELNAVSSTEGNLVYSKGDNLLVESFVKQLKKLKGDWSRNGLQRVIRLNSECSHKYISLRNSNIKADIPFSEAFKDPYTLIEQQIYRKLMALKSKYTNKYLCYNYITKNFVLKPLNNIDKFCVFFYTVKSLNKYTFSIGTNKSINLTFNKYGHLIGDVSQAKLCRNKSIVFQLHTKSTDNLDQFKSINSHSKTTKLLKNENIYLNLSQSLSLYDNKKSRPKQIKSKNNFINVNTTMSTREYKIYLFKANKRSPMKSNVIRKSKNIKYLKQ